MQRRVEQADRDRQAVHDLEQLLEVRALGGEQLGERGAAALLVIGQDHLAHRADAVALEEHMLGARQADALGAEILGGTGVQRGFRIGAHFQAAHAVGPAHQRAELAGELRLKRRHRAGDHLAGGAVDGEDVALLERDAARGEGARSVIDADGAGTAHARLAHAARDDGGVRGHAAARREDALRGMHAVNVFRRGLDAHQDDLAALRLEVLRIVGREHDLARGGTRRGRQAGADDLLVGLGVEHRVQKLVERGGVDAGDGLFARQHAGIGQFHRDAQRGLGGALARAGLQHPELAALDGEFEVLHVAIVALEHAGDADELGVDLRQRPLHGGLVGAGLLARDFGDVLRGADARHHVLALRVDEELAIERVLTRGGVAGEGDAGGRGLAHVAEHHGLDVHGRAPALGDGVQAAIDDGALVHPRTEHRADGAPELVLRVLRERPAELVRDQRLVAPDDVLPVVGGQVGVEVVVVVGLVAVQHFLEMMVREVQHHVRVHLDEAAIAVIGEAGVARGGGHGFDRDVVEAEIQHRVHHAGHGRACTRTNGNQKRVGGIAEGAVGQLAHRGERGVDIGFQLGRVHIAVGVIIGAHLGGDGEAGGDRQAEVRHFREVRALAAKKIAHLGGAFCGTVAEGVDPFRHFGSPLV